MRIAPPLFEEARMTDRMFAWSALESFRRLSAVPCLWRRRLGTGFTAFNARFLQRTPITAGSYPCVQGCGCAHEVIRHSSTEVVAVCRCESWCCDDVSLSSEDIVLWELNLARLGRSLSQALGLQVKHAELNLNATRQIGAWSAQAVPVILTIQHTSVEFAGVVAALVARLREPFVLLSPSARHLDVPGKELLANIGAGFFALDAIVRVTSQGVLEPRQTPGELFGRFSARPEPNLPEDIARRAFALVEQLDSERPLKAPTVLTVFRLYCIEEMSAAQIARRTHCSKATIIRRLEMIQARTGVDPQNLRRVATQFNKIEEDLGDARAEHIHRRRLIYDEEEAED
jgi:hypothetical protein